MRDRANIEVDARTVDSCWKDDTINADSAVVTLQELALEVLLDCRDLLASLQPAKAANKEPAWLPVVSKRIAACRYYPQTSELVLRFNDKSMYLYKDVSLFTYQSFMDSDSKGKFFEHNIKGEYPTEHIGTYNA